MNTENLRYHAAGHIAAAVLIAQSHPKSASIILNDVLAFASHEKVNAPPELLDKLNVCIADPKANQNSIMQLEQWFVDPLNTIIEKSGAKL